MDQKTDYAKGLEEKHRRKIVLPCVIPWECGSNKFASQKGSAGFGTIRDANRCNHTYTLAIFRIELKIHSSKPLSESNDGVVPQITCPPLHTKRASQAGQSSFGNFREQVTRVTDKDGDERIAINKIVDDKMTETILKKWDRPNKDATNSDIGRRRDQVHESSGGRRFTKEELNQSRAAIPRFQDPRQTVAAQYAKSGEGFQGHRQRQATTLIEGLDDLDQLERNRYMAWIGGQITMQSQSQTGGFSKPRDVVSTSYYDRLMHERQLDPKVIRKRLEEEKAKRELEEKEENEDSGAHTLSE